MGVGTPGLVGIIPPENLAAEVVADGQVLTRTGTTQAWIAPAGGGSAISLRDETTDLTDALAELTFTGTGVECTEPGADDHVTCTIAGGGGGGGLSEAQVDARIAPYGRISPSGQILDAQIPTEIVRDTSTRLLPATGQADGRLPTWQSGAPVWQDPVGDGRVESGTVAGTTLTLERNNGLADVVVTDLPAPAPWARDADWPTGTAPVARLGTGIPTSSDFLRGDGVWAVPGGWRAGPHDEYQAMARGDNPDCSGGSTDGRDRGGRR